MMAANIKRVLKGDLNLINKTADDVVARTNMTNVQFLTKRVKRLIIISTLTNSTFGFIPSSRYVNKNKLYLVATD